MSTTLTAPTPTGPGQPGPRGMSRLWRREFTAYPGRAARLSSLAIVVVTTVLFYYQYYTISAVGDQVIASTGMSFRYFVMINVVSVLLSSVTSLLGGFTDRYGRANIVVLGLLGCALVCLIGFPLAESAFAVGFCYALLGAFEGIVLVATPALVRDFSPQVGRATAMGFWTIGPVAGSLLTAAIVTPTIEHVDRWQDEYAIAGVIGLAVFVLAALYLRELSAPLRDQVVVSEREAALADARARGLDTDAALASPLRQVLRLDILGSALAISLFLIVYFAAVGFLPIFFQTVFGYSASKANSIGNWMWGFEALALIGFGWISDRLGVRKPLMLVGGIGAVVMTGFVMRNTTDAGTSYREWVITLSLLTLFMGLAFAPWMASFTETVERRNPALTATGLSLWGGMVRLVATVVTFVLPFMVSSATTLIQDGPAVQALAAGRDPDLTATQNATVKAVAADPTIATRVQTLAARYKTGLAAADKLSPATSAALSRTSDDPAVQVAALAEITGLPATTVGRVVTIERTYPAELAAADTIDSATQLALLTNPGDAATRSKAVAEIARGLRVTPAVAAQRLAALARVPSSDLIFMSTNAPPVSRAADGLTALGKIPAADLAYLQRYGTPLQSGTVQAKLRYLAAEGPKVQRAAKDSPAEWNRYWLLGLLGQVLFLPLLFVMAGYWNPRRAKRAAAEHQAKVEAELAAIAAGRS